MFVFEEARTENVVSRLLHSDEPAIRYRILVNLLGTNPDSKEAQIVREKIRHSARVGLLLSERKSDGKIPFHPYSKWYGAHWILSLLADLNYPPGDKSLIPLRDQVYDWLFSQEHLQQTKYHHIYSGSLKMIRDRARIHASMEGNALYSIMKLGLFDERTDELADRLLQTQWSDGGWNCDKTPSASHSSFTESLVPLRGLVYHSKMLRRPRSASGARRAAEFFLERHLYRRLHDDRVIREDFLNLHYPPYWHYDILFGLRVIGESGLIRDSRCHDALELLKSKRLRDGGFPAERKYYSTTKGIKTGRSLVDWGVVSNLHMNEFVTADAFHVLKQADTSVEYETILE